MGEMGRDFDGSYAEYVLLPNEQIYTVRTDLSWPIMAAIPETYHTAFGTLQNLKVENGDTVLVRGATSGVGVAFAKLLKARYSKVQLYGSTRSMNKREQLLAAGFDECILDNSGRLVTDMAFDKIADMVEPAKVFTLAEIREAQAYLDSTESFGKVVVLND